MAVIEHIKAPPAVPQELIERAQWVVWRYETREGDPKPTKVPYSPGSGRRAKSTDSSTWGTYRQACSVWRNRSYDGVGFVFSASDPYCGIDLDGCYDPTTGALSELAEEILATLQTYAEFSPSGTGIHIFVKASLPAAGRRRDALGIEIYQQNRFFTVTGNPVADMPPTIEERADLVATLYREYFAPDGAVPDDVHHQAAAPSDLSDREIYDIATHAINGPRFAALWRGDTSAHDHNDSSADLALCNMLAFYTGDPGRTDTLFRQSGLMRPKWDEMRGASTYGQMTIDAAFRGRIDFYASRVTPFALPPPMQDTDPASGSWQGQAEDQARASGELRYRFLTDEEQDHLPKPQYLIAGLLLEQGINMLFGESQSGKTFLAIDLALCVATDRQWNGHHTEHGAIAYIAGEDALGVIQRKKVWKRHFGYASTPHFLVLPDNVPMLLPGELSELVKSLKTLPQPLRLIVIDTLSCAMVGSDSDKTKDAVQFMEAVKHLRNLFGCAILLVHHKNKNGAELGNSSFRNGSDIMLDLSMDGDCVKIACEKVKNAPHFDPIYLTLAQTHDSCVLLSRDGETDEHGRLPESVAATLTVLKEHFSFGASPTEWHKALDISQATFYRHVQTLKAAGYVAMTQQERGTKYTLTSMGRGYSHYSHVTLTDR